MNAQPDNHAQVLRPLLGGACVLAFVVALLVRVPAADAAESAPPVDTVGLVQKVRPALAVLVSIDRRGEWKSFGTGFFISEDGILVTARHVAQSQDNLLVITQDGRRHSVTHFLGEDRDYDIAVLKIEGTGWACLKPATALPKLNESVALVSPTDQWFGLFKRTNVPPVCSTGKLTSLVELPGLWLSLGTSVSARPGQSGSPLLNPAGEVVGVTPFISAEQQATASPMTVAQAIATRASTSEAISFRKRPRKGGPLPLVMDPDFRAGSGAMARQDWAEMERRMKPVVKRFRESPVPLALLGAACAKRAAWKQVHAYCGKAFRLRPSAFTALVDGTSLVAMGRLADGSAAVRKALDLGLQNPELHTSAWTLLATAETALGRPEQAQTALENLQKLDPDAAAKLRPSLEEVAKAATKK